MVDKLITNTDLSKASGADCIPVVFLKNCEPEILHNILAGLFHIYLKESCFPDVQKAFSNYRPFSLLTVVSKIFEKFNSRLVDQFKKYGLFLVSSMVSGLFDQLQIFQQLYLIKFLELFIDLGLFKSYHYIFTRFSIGMLVFFTNSISGWAFALIFSLQSQTALSCSWVKSLQEYPVNAGVTEDSLLILHFSYNTLMTFLMMLSVILLTTLMALLSSLSVIRHLICGYN